MLHRYTIAFLIAAAVAGACSGSQNEGVSPGTAASTTTDTAVSTTAEFVPPSIVAAVPSTAIPVAAATPAAATVPEAEVPPSTVSPAGSASETSVSAAGTAVPFTTMPDATTPPVAAAVLEVEVPPNTLSSWIAPMINEATEICLGEESLILDFGCVRAVRRVCNSGIYFLETYENKLISGDENTVKFTCDLTAIAEVAVFATVLNYKYNDRFYSMPELSYCRPSSLEFETAGFRFFHAAVDYWEFQLGDLFFAVVGSYGGVADKEIPCLVAARGYEVYDYDHISDMMLDELNELYGSVSRLLLSYRNSGSNEYSEIEITQFESFLQNTETLTSRSEFESLWRQLQYICATAEITEEISLGFTSPRHSSLPRTANIAPEFSFDDACRRAAIAVCRHSNAPTLETWQPQDWYKKSLKNPVVDFSCSIALNALPYHISPTGECISAINTYQAGHNPKADDVEICMDSFSNCNLSEEERWSKQFCDALTETLNLAIKWQQLIIACETTIANAYMDPTSEEAIKALNQYSNALVSIIPSRDCQQSAISICEVENTPKPYSTREGLPSDMTDMIKDLANRNSKIQHTSCMLTDNST